MKKVLLFILLICTAVTTAQTIIYVKADAAGSVGDQMIPQVNS